MQIVVTGGTGTIGRRLVYHLLQFGHVVTVVSRQPYKPANLPAKIIFASWDGKTTEGWGSLVDGADAVVNLAGAGIADETWTDARKKEIEESRVNAGQAVVEAIRAASARPKVLIQASAVGYYGVQNNDKVITEDHPPANDFLGRTCQAWEASTEAVEALGVRRAVIRSGVVFDMQGGALPRIVFPFRLFAGGPIGSGRQWFPWIHYCDEVEAIRFLIHNEAASGPFNLTAPNPVRSRELAKAIGKVLKRPALAPAPAFAFKTMFGEMSTVLLDGQQAVPKRLQELGYAFKFLQIEAALRDLLDQS
jgi:uncharacterized protein (TIGR01777 family)